MMSTQAVLQKRTATSHLILWGLAALLAGPAWAASPVLKRITPPGLQRGAQSELNFNGARLADAQAILFDNNGFEVSNLQAKANQVKALVKVAPNTRLGEHAARVRTRSGVSEVRTFFVGPYPSVAEQEPNSEFDKPQKLAMNVTVQGVIQSEDVDYFLVEAKKGQRVSAEVEGMRLANTVFDPYLAILNRERFELAARDDCALLYQDAAASIIAPQDGTYVIQVRDSSFGGNGNCLYRLHVGSFPRPTAVFPSGGKAGEEIAVRFLGDPAGEIAQKQRLPEKPDPLFALEAKQDGLVAPSPNPFRVSAFDNVLEVEPNNDFKGATATEQALPLALNGIIADKGDVDCFKFKATKGQQFDVHCYARRLRSPLDSVMSLYDAQGKRIANNDDSGGPDSYIRFNVPADGEYFLRVTDHLGSGGLDYTFRIELTPIQPALELSIPKFARYSQQRHFVVVPRGNRFGTVVNIRRANLGGDVVLSAEGLPPGVQMVTETVPANMGVFPIVFEAAADAPIDGGWGNLLGRPADPKLAHVVGSFSQRYEMIVGPPGQSVYWWHRIDKLPMAVVEEAPFTLELVEPQVPIVRDGSMQLKVVAQRKEGFDAPISVQFPFRPPGIGATTAITIPQGKSEAFYPINANGNAQIHKWKVFVLGQADAGGAVWASSKLVTLEVAAPYVGLTINMAATEQGQPAEVVCKITPNTSWEGKAKLSLLGLPAKCSTADLEIDKSATEAVFKVATDKTSPTGQHKTLLCQLTVTQQGEPILHSLGRGGVLRIDPPPPPKKDAPPPKPAAAKVTQKPAPEKPAKRLSRLEKLRLQQAERAKTSGGD